VGNDNESVARKPFFFLWKKNKFPPNFSVQTGISLTQTSWSNAPSRFNLTQIASALWREHARAQQRCRCHQISGGLAAWHNFGWKARHLSISSTRTAISGFGHIAAFSTKGDIFPRSIGGGTGHRIENQWFICPLVRWTPAIFFAR